MAPNLHCQHAQKHPESLLWLADVVTAAVELHASGADPSYVATLTPVMLAVNQIRP